MGGIVYVPIEPLEERYSEQWDRWFKTTFKKYNYNYISIYGESLKDKIENGRFLDIVNTNYYKASQLKQICKLIDEGLNNVTFLFMDLWFPGLEMIAYMRDLLNLDIKIKGILHAGTYDPYDFLAQKGLGRWGSNLEKSWLELTDQIFVATDFHKDLICSQRGKKFANKIFITGLPTCSNEYRLNREDLIKNKRDIIVFPHRLDSEKQPEVFNRFECLFKQKYPRYKEYQFIKSKLVCKNKSEYYDLLAKSKAAFSSALQETFGIAMLEASALGAYPVVPDGLSYKQVFSNFPRYNNLDEACDILFLALTNFNNLKHCPYDNALDNIMEELCK